MKVNLVYNKGFKWFSENNIYAKGKALHSNGEFLSNESLCRYFRDSSKGEFVNKLKELNGIFSVVVINPQENKLWAAVDKQRFFPLFYKCDNNEIFLSDNIDEINKGCISEINKEGIIAMRSMGYTLGKSTLIKDVFQLRVGEYLICDNHNLQVDTIQGEFKTKEINTSDKILKDQIKTLFFEVGKRMVQQIKSQPVAIPLSGGWDSRIITLLLRLNGIEDVVCFTYGNPYHKEACKSKQVAEKLDYAWRCIDYAPYVGENYTLNPSFREYVDFISNGNCFPYVQEYFAGRYLKEEWQLSQNTIIIPGHSGDALGGSQLYPDMESFPSITDFALKLYRKHGRYIFLSKKERKTLMELIISYLDNPQPTLTFLQHDIWTLSERLIKQPTNSAKAWNYFGYETIFPLWDNELVNTFISLPFRYRVFKKLYNEVLEEIFIENDILLEGESTQAYTKKQQKVFLKMKLKPYIENLLQYKKKKDPYNFFYFTDLLKPIIEEIPPIRMNEYNAYLSEWYVQHFIKKYS